MKALGWIIGLAALLIVAIGVYVVMNSGALLERAIESYGSSYLGAPVEVEEVTVSLTDGTAGMKGLVVHNPPGYSGPPAFRLGDVNMTLNTDELSGQLIVLEQVTVDGAEISALMKGREMNLKRLMDNLNENLGPSQQPEEADPAEVKLIIDQFDFTNASASVDSDVLGQAQVDVPDVHLSGIGRQSNGATVGQALKQILEPVIRAVMRQMAEQGIDLEGAREELQQKLEDRGREALEGGLDRLRQGLQSQSDEQAQDQP